PRRVSAAPDGGPTRGTPARRVDERPRTPADHWRTASTCSNSARGIVSGSAFGVYGGFRGMARTTRRARRVAMEGVRDAGAAGWGRYVPRGGESGRRS